MTVDSSQDLRSLGEAGYADDRWRPTATGTAANRPAVGLFRANAFYYATDTGVLSYSNGVAWTDLTPGTTALGAWTSYTPTWTSTGTAPTAGNSAFTGAYGKIGKTVSFNVYFPMGSTATFGTGLYRWALPVASTGQVIGSGYIYDSSANAVWTVSLLRVTTTTFRLLFTAGGGLYDVSQTAPFTWAVADEINVACTYEAA